MILENIYYHIGKLDLWPGIGDSGPLRDAPANSSSEPRSETSVPDLLHQDRPPGETRMELLPAAEEHGEALHQQHASCSRVPDGQEEEGCLKVHEGDRPGALRSLPAPRACHLRHLVPRPLVHEARRRQLHEAEGAEGRKWISWTVNGDKRGGKAVKRKKKNWKKKKRKKEIKMKIAKIMILTILRMET